MRDAKAASPLVDTHLAALIATRMTTATKQRLLLAFSSVLVGYAVGAIIPKLAAQSVPPSQVGQRWEQFCDRPAYTTTAINANLRQRGAEGFEFVSVSFPQGSTTLWTCFRRPAAR